MLKSKQPSDFNRNATQTEQEENILCLCQDLNLEDNLFFSNHGCRVKSPANSSWENVWCNKNKHGCMTSLMKGPLTKIYTNI